MSLKAMKELVEWVKAHHGGSAEIFADRAHGEIRALEKAADALNDEEVRRALRHAPDGVREATALISVIAKEAK